MACLRVGFFVSIYQLVFFNFISYRKNANKYMLSDSMTVFIGLLLVLL